MAFEPQDSQEGSTFQFDHESKDESICKRSNIIDGNMNNVDSKSKLVVLKASWGLIDVTHKVQSLIVQNVLEFVPRNRLFGDGWKGKTKSCVIVYSYNINNPQNGVFSTHCAFCKEKTRMTITPASTWPEHFFPVKNENKSLYIYGAVYGGGKYPFGDCTAITQALVKENSLQIDITNKTFGDTWTGKKKSFTIVYTYHSANQLVQMRLTSEKGQVTIA